MKLFLFVRNLENYMLPCFNKKLFGINCLGCGFQRAVLLLLKGEFIAAFKMYPAIYGIILFIVFLLLNSYFKFKKRHTIIRYSLIGLLLTLVTQYLFKMNLFTS